MFRIMHTLRTLCFLCLVIVFAVPSFAQNIRTVAGGGPNNVPALSAAISSLSAVAFDSSGNYYITTLTRVFRVDQSGQLTVYAGNGGLGFNGDGIAATSAELCNPHGIAFDSTGNLFIADECNDRVRRVDAATRIITTVAGNGTAGYSGDAGPAASAALSGPSAVTVDRQGNLFISDSNNGRIRRVDANTQIITTIPMSGLANPSGIALDGAGNLFFADADGQRVLRLDSTTGMITQVAGNGFRDGCCSGGFSGDGGPATSAELNVPNSLVVDSAGNLFIADTFNYRIRRVDAATGVITTIAGDGTPGFSGDGGLATSAELNAPSGIALGSAGSLFIADSFNFRIRRTDPSTQVITTVAGNGTYSFSGDGGPAAASQLNDPQGVAVDNAGNLFIADSMNNRIRRIDAATQVITTVAGNGTIGVSGDGGPATSAALSGPLSVAVDSAGNLFIGSDLRIRRLDAATGVITTVAGSGIFGECAGSATSTALPMTTGVAVDNGGNLFISGNRENSFRGIGLCRVDAATQMIGTYASSGFGSGAPVGVAVDRAGNLFFAVDEGGFYVDYGAVFRADAATQAVSRVAGGGFCGVDCSFSGDGGPATSAVLADVSGVGVDGAGNLFIIDTDRVRRVDAATQVIATVAGGGSCPLGSCSGFLGDGGPATSAELNFPLGVAVDNAGSLFIADSGSNRIREVVASKQATSLAVSSSANPSVFGQAVTLSVTVSAASGSAIPTGTVTFSDAANTLGTATLSGGQATLNFSSSVVTAHSITAVYSGDDGFLGATSGVFTQTLNRASATTVVASSMTQVTLGQALTFTVTVSPVAPSAGAPSGTVTLQDGTTILSTIPLNSSGSAMLTVSSFAVAAHQITATYSGDNGFLGSNGSLTENVSYAIRPLYDQTRLVPSGAIFPIKLYLGDASGNDVSSTAVPLHATRITSASGYSASMTSPGSANPGGSFRFEAALGPAGGYILNLNTTGLASGSYTLQFSAGSHPLPHALNFAVR